MSIRVLLWYMAVVVGMMDKGNWKQRTASLMAI
jgi:hypothetical protein